MYKIIKKIIILVTLLLTVLLGSNYSFGETASQPKTLQLFEQGNGRPSGFYTVNRQERRTCLTSNQDNRN